MTARTGFSDDYDERRQQAFSSIEQESQFDMHGYSFDRDMTDLIESLNTAVHALETQGKTNTKFYKDFTKEIGEFNDFFSKSANRERFIRTSGDTSREMLQWRSAGINPAGNIANHLLSRSLEKMFTGTNSVFERTMRETYDRMRGFDRYLGRQNIWSQIVSPDGKTTRQGIGLSHHQRTASRLSHYADDDVGLPLTTERNADVSLRGSRSNPVLPRTRYGGVMERVVQQAIAEEIASGTPGAGAGRGHGMAETVARVATEMAANVAAEPRGAQAALNRVRTGLTNAGPGSYIAANAQEKALMSSGIYGMLHIGGQGAGTSHSSAYSPDFSWFHGLADKTPAQLAAERYAYQLRQMQKEGYGEQGGYQAGEAGLLGGTSGALTAQTSKNRFGWANIKGAIQGYNLPDRWAMMKVKGEKLAENHGGQITGITQAVGGGIIGIFNAMSKVTDQTAKGISEAFSAMGDLTTNQLKAFQGIIDGMTEMMTAPTNLVSGGLGSIGGMLGGIGGSLGRGGGGGSGGGGGKGGAAAIALAAVGIIMQVIGSFMRIGISALKMGVGIFKSILGTVVKISKQMLSTSPVFNAMLNILNLAYTMLLLPFATAFSDQLIPVVESILNFSMDIGEKLNTIVGAIPQETLDKLTNGLTEMAEAFVAGVGTIGAEFWSNMIDSILGMAKVISDPSFPKMIADFIGLIPSLLSMATTIVDFMTKNSEDIANDVKAGLTVFTKMVTEGFFTKFLTFSITILDKLQAKADDIASMITVLVDDLPTIMSATVDLANFFVGTRKAVKTVSDTFGKIPMAAESAYNSLKDAASGFHFATGGYVPATSGGQLVTVAEGGEGEYIIPESKMGGVTVNFNGPVYGTDDFKAKVKSIVSEVTNTSYFR